MKCKIVVMALASLYATEAPGRNIVMVSNITNDATNYGSVLIDLDMLASNSARREFWSYIFTRSGSDYVRGANDTEADCGKGSVRYVRRKMFTDAHTLSGELDQPTRWTKPALRSPEAKMLRLVCGIEKPSEADLLGDVDPIALSDPLLNNPKFR